MAVYPVSPPREQTSVRDLPDECLELVLANVLPDQLSNVMQVSRDSRDRAIAVMEAGAISREGRRNVDPQQLGRALVRMARKGASITLGHWLRNPIFAQVPTSKLIEALSEAVINRQAAFVQELIDSNRAILEDVTLPIDVLKEALLLAAKHGHATVVQALIDSPRMLETFGWVSTIDALLLAAEHGHATVVQALIDSPRILAAHGGSVSSYALLSAAQNGHARAVQTLIDSLRMSGKLQGCDLREALKRAAKHGHATVVQALINSPCFQSIPRSDIIEAFCLAVENNQAATAQKFIDIPKQISKSLLIEALVTAVNRNHEACVEMLINAIGYRAFPILHHPLFDLNSLISIADEKGHAAIAGRLRGYKKRLLIIVTTQAAAAAVAVFNVSTVLSHACEDPLGWCCRRLLGMCFGTQ